MKFAPCDGSERGRTHHDANMAFFRRCPHWGRDLERTRRDGIATRPDIGGRLSTCTRGAKRAGVPRSGLEEWRTAGGPEEQGEAPPRTRLEHAVKDLPIGGAGPGGPSTSRASTAGAGEASSRTRASSPKRPSASSRRAPSCAATVKKLSDQERQLLEMYYYNDMSLEQVGENARPVEELDEPVARAGVMASAMHRDARRILGP